MVVWCGMLIAQPLLVRGGRRDLHRALGVASYGLVPLLLVASLLLAHTRFRVMDEATFQAEAPNLFLPLSAALLLALAYALAVANRRSPALHARFMICTSLPMIDPVVGRLLAFYLPPLSHSLLYQAVTFGATDLILLSLAVQDRREGRARWVFPAMLAPFITMHVLWFTLAQSHLWRPIAAWYRSLPLT
jgi:hypothetical protein